MDSISQSAAQELRRWSVSEVTGGCGVSLKASRCAVSEESPQETLPVTRPHSRLTEPVGEPQPAELCGRKSSRSQIVQDRPLTLTPSLSLPCSPDSEDAPSWPSATGPGLVTVPNSANGSSSGSGPGGGDIRSPSLSSDEQSSEASLITESGGIGGPGTPLPTDTPDNLTLLVLDSVAGKRHGLCTGRAPLSRCHMVQHGCLLMECCGGEISDQESLKHQFDLRGGAYGLRCGQPPGGGLSESSQFSQLWMATMMIN